jgi:hypothetical protein
VAHAAASNDAQAFSLFSAEGDVYCYEIESLLGRNQELCVDFTDASLRQLRA